MNRPQRRLGALLAVLSFTAVCAGCSSTSGDLASSVSAGQLKGGSIAKAVDLSGKSFTVGSKEFTEQTVLGNILIYALQAAGAKTKDQTGLTGSAIVRKALRGGDIDMYWEYAGTGWSEFLKKTSVLPGAREQFDETARLDEEQNKITWLGPAKFGDQYAIARAGDAEGPAGEVDKLSQLKQLAKDHPGEVTLCGAAEFLDREIGPVQKVYDVRIPATQVYQNAFALNFVNVAKQSPCNFAEVFTTDARIKSLGLKVLDDDKTHFLTQLVGLTLREKTAKENPELKTLVQLLGDKLTQQVIIELNGMVDIDGATPQQAAVKFLRDEGFIA
ncbi:glycine betaine ABC transporter substrate-binding protein [Streptomyces sp. GESEQ-35]|uniref:ABC transporter substrate-binding protein n=1 Tax=Streptomyces sp. GESEQ-35 TaxID=2812657 RepID=UPI001B32C436|nr:glycine betaine ABC transporter substrate-binding protein [Streptomyces sp. GESEQ-35]